MADESKAPKEGSIESVEVEQAKPADDMSKAELEEVLVNKEDIKLHPSPGAKLPDGVEEPNEEPNNPPYSTGRPDQPILSGLATGPGAHTPPPADEFDAQGRPRQGEAAK